jgi:GNAT superfamily N-acetyltransferase
LPGLSPKIGLDIREFKPADIDVVRQINRPSEFRACAQRLAKGHHGLLACHYDQPVGYAWTSPGDDLSLERVKLPLQPGDALCVDVYTVPAFRRLGIHTALTLARFQLLRDLGYNRAVAYIDVQNTPSLGVWKKVDAQVIGHIDFKRVGPWRRTHYSIKGSTSRFYGKNFT